MELKRTSLLFENGLRRAMKEDPEGIRYSKGMRAIMTFINNVMMCSFRDNFYEEFPCDVVFKKMFTGGYSENCSIISALNQSSRIASVVYLCNIGFVKVEMYFFRLN